MTPELKKIIRKAWRNTSPPGRNVRWIHHTINERAQIAAAIQEHSVDGKIGIVTRGRDCDCVFYHHENIIDVPTPMSWQLEQDRAQEWLDGPETTVFTSPLKIDKGRNESRDLALEAHEDGHPHIVYSPAI